MADRYVMGGLIDYSFGLSLVYIAECILTLPPTYPTYFLYMKT
jgi:hypothetical protein